MPQVVEGYAVCARSCQHAAGQQVVRNGAKEVYRQRHIACRQSVCPSAAARSASVRHPGALPDREQPPVTFRHRSPEERQAAVRRRQQQCAAQWKNIPKMLAE